MIQLDLIAYIFFGFASIAFIGGWILWDRGLSWTFLVALMAYIPDFYFLLIKSWTEFIGVGLLFLALIHLYFYDLYYSDKATRGGRR